MGSDDQRLLNRTLTARSLNEVTRPDNRASENMEFKLLGGFKGSRRGEKVIESLGAGETGEEVQISSTRLGSHIF